MASNKRDANRVPNISGVSTVTFTGTIEPAVDPATHRLQVDANLVTTDNSINIDQWGGTSTTLGQKVMASSVPVALASDQSAFPVSQSGTWSFNLTQIASAGTTSAGVLGTLAVGGNQAANTPVSSSTNPIPIVGSDYGGTPTLRLWKVDSSGTGYVSITNTAAINIAQVGGLTAAVNNGTVNGSVLRVTLAADSTGQVTLAAGSQTIGQLTANQSVNINQINGITPLMGNGATGTGSQRVTIASDNTAFSVNATLSAETTKVLGVVRNADGSGNLLTSNSTTYTAKFGLDMNLLGTLGTAFSTAGKVDVKGADGDVFVRQTTGTNLHVVADSGSTTAVTGTVATAEVAPTTISNGKKTVTTAGTRVTLASTTTVKSVTIKALVANTGTIFVGNSTVASTNGYALAPGDTVSLDIADLVTVNIDSSVNGEGVTYIAIN